MADTDENKEPPICVSCSSLEGKEREDCEELTKLLAEEVITLETFSNAMIDKLSGNADKFIGIFCDTKDESSLLESEEPKEQEKQTQEQEGESNVGDND